MRQLLYILLLSPILLVASCQETTITREQVLTTLDSLEHKLQWVEYRLRQEEWQTATTGSSDSLEYFHGLYDHVIKDPGLVRTLQAGQRLLQDEEAIRRCDLMRATVVLGQVESASTVASLRDSLLHLGRVAEAEIPYHLQTLCCNESDRIDRERSYRARCSVGDKLGPGLGQLIRMRNQEARRLGYNNCLALSFAQYDLDPGEYLALIEKINSLSAAPYSEIVAKLQAQFGSSSIEVWDFGFLYDEVNKQVDRYIPVDSQLSFIDKSLEQLGFDLDELPIYIDVRQAPAITGSADYRPIWPPYDVRLSVGLAGGLHNTQALLHHIGRGLHQTHIVQQRSLFANGLAVAWAEGMAQTISALCQDDQWLATYAGLPQALIDTYQAAHNEQEVIRLRMMLVDLMFEYEAYANPNRDLNKLYWDLFERYLMLPRHDELQPWATVVSHFEQPVSMPNHLFAKMIAAQIIDEVQSEYSGLADNPDVGAYLNQNYFRFGARYDWRDLLERGTGEKLKPEYLISSLGI